MFKGLIYAVLTVISIIYSVIVYRVGSGTCSFLLWLGMGAFFAFLLFMEKIQGWQKVSRHFAMGFKIAVGFFVIILLACNACIFSQFFSKGQKDLDYIIVLGAQMREYGPSVVYKARLDAAVDYLNSNPNTICVVTGGQGSNENISEGEGGRDYMVKCGIPTDRILVEKQSVNTDENITYALDVIKGQEANADSSEQEIANLKLGIVTNNFHVFRGCYIAEKYVGSKVSGIAARTEYLYLPSNLLRESFGIIKDLF